MNMMVRRLFSTGCGLRAIGGEEIQLANSGAALGTMVAGIHGAPGRTHDAYESPIREIL